MKKITERGKKDVQSKKEELIRMKLPDSNLIKLSPISKGKSISSETNTIKNDIRGSL